jgi:hypothetical protein
VTLRLAGAPTRALHAESSRLGVPIESLASFAVLYYLSDLDSGRTSRPSLGASGDRSDTPLDQLGLKRSSSTMVQAVDRALTPTRRGCDLRGR